MTYLSDDTICALATAAGGAMAMIRVSGPSAINITDTMFESPSGHKLGDCASHRAHYGTLKAIDGSVIDDVVVVVFRGPHSYTGDDTTEISCHGSRYIITLILQTLIHHGCRQAEPGEYTKRAFLNGKLDLSQAEAVADLITSTNSATHKMAMSQLRGNFSSRLSQLRDSLLHLTTLLELELDFSDHDVEFADREELQAIARETSEQISILVNSFSTGKALREGIAVAIVGKTNVGKSTLLNRLLHDDKAIVSDIHGTTRDVIEDCTQIGNVTFRFIDTAGLRHTDDTIEQMGIERTYQKLDEATIVLWMTDEAPTPQETQEMLHYTEGKKLIAVVNKIDKEDIAFYDPMLSTEGVASSVPVIRISAKKGINIDLLEDALLQAAAIPQITQNDVIINNVRHYEALLKAQEDMRIVEEGLRQGLSGDLLSEDLRSCISHLSDIVGGNITPDETLQNIFSHFCVGK